MKKLAKILPLLLSCVMALSVGAMAAEDPAVTEATTVVQEETTTQAQEETTTEIQEETTTEPTTVPEVTQPEEETTTEAADETTTAPDTTTTQPDVTEPEVTEPDVTEPENPVFVLPKSPQNVAQSYGAYGYVDIWWDEVEDVEGYDVYLKVKDEWVYQTSVYEASARIENLLCNSTYEIAVKSYITVNAEKYSSEEYSTVTVKTASGVPQVFLKGTASPDGVVLSWETQTSVSGYRIYIRQSGKWVKITDINDKTVGEYLYTDVKANKEYSFAIKAFVRSTEGLKWSSIDRIPVKYPDYTKAVIKSVSATNSSATVKWNEVEDATGYRVYIYKNGKWSYYKGIKTNSYTVTGLEASTKYKFKVRAYFKADGKTTWGTYSDEMSVTTKQKTVKSYRISKLKKYFTDDDWSVKVSGLKDSEGLYYDLTIAVKGNNIFARYDYQRNEVIRDFEYLIQLDKERVYLIFDDNKTYCVLPDEEAVYVAANICAVALVFDMSTAKNVTAKTTVYKNKTAVAEIYTDKDLGIKKTYYFINDKLSGLKIGYSDGTTESFKSIKINDTPSSSAFKVPKGYKKVTY